MSDLLQQTLSCPTGQTFNTEYSIQWMHLQDAIISNFDNAHNIDLPMANFWDGVGEIYPETAYMSMNLFADDPVDIMPDIKFWEKLNPFLSYKNGGTSEKVKEYLDETNSVSGYDVFGGSWKALVQAANTNEGNIMGWNDTNASLRVVTLHTDTIGKIQSDTQCPADVVWHNCADTMANAAYVDPFNPIDSFNLPSMSDAVQNMDVNILYRILLSSSFGGDIVPPSTLAWWKQRVSALKAQGFNVVLTTSPDDIFSEITDRLLEDACIDETPGVTTKTPAGDDTASSAVTAMVGSLAAVVIAMMA